MRPRQLCDYNQAVSQRQHAAFTDGRWAMSLHRVEPHTAMQGLWWAYISQWEARIRLRWPMGSDDTRAYMFKLLSSLKRVLLPELSVINGLHYSSAPAPGTCTHRKRDSYFPISIFHIGSQQSALLNLISAIKYVSDNYLAIIQMQWKMLLMWPQLNRGQMLRHARVATFHSFHSVIVSLC